jgi:hypothetical protein
MDEVVPEAHHEQIAIADLLPTQMTVGIREVDMKRMRWRERSINSAVRYLSTHRVPVVVGPDNRHYMIDRHHLTMALYDEGVTEVPVSVVGSINRSSFGEFWATLESRGWTHPFDDEGRRRPFENMPTSIANLMDDPFRSLAGALKRAGGFAKNRSPFSEFRWADFLRCRIDRELVERDLGRALAIAMNLAQSRDAAGLPGWQRHPEH